MKKIVFAIMAMAIMALALGLFGCQKEQTAPVANEPVFNETLNNELEGLTQTEQPAFVEFMFDYNKRNDSKYELAETDIFTELGEGINSSELSVFGVMLGDSYATVLEQLGIPDVTLVPADKSYKNMEYGRKIGVGGTETALTFHLENDIVTQINIRKTFSKYLKGNTTAGTTKEDFYKMLDVPEFTDFTTTHRVLHYVENGVDLYLYRDKLDIISLVPPKVFKGVKYVTTRYEAAPGIWFNQTKPVLIE